jgi:hypothetical protein
VTLNMLDLLDRPEGRTAIAAGADDAVQLIYPHLGGGQLGGTVLAYNVTVHAVLEDPGPRHLRDEKLDSGYPDPEDGAYDYVQIAADKRDLSLRTGLTVRQAIAQGLRRPTEVEWIGNAVVALDKLGHLLLIISCSGVADLGDEAAAELMAGCIKLRLLAALATLQAEEAENTPAEA